MGRAAHYAPGNRSHFDEYRNANANHYVNPASNRHAFAYADINSIHHPVHYAIHHADALRATAQRFTIFTKALRCFRHQSPTEASEIFPLIPNNAINASGGISASGRSVL